MTVPTAMKQITPRPTGMGLGQRHIVSEFAESIVPIFPVIRTSPIALKLSSLDNLQIQQAASLVNRLVFDHSDGQQP